MGRSLLKLLVALLMLSSISAAQTDTPEPIDWPDLPPHVIDCSPGAFATNVPVDLNEISVTFDRPMNTVESGKFARLAHLGDDPIGLLKRAKYPEPYGQEIAWNEAGTECRVRVQLADDTTYVVGVNMSPGVSRFRDTAGADALGYVWVFSTGDRSEDEFPGHVVSSDPPMGATDVDPALGEMRITFSRPVAPGRFGGYAVPGWGEWPGRGASGQHLSADGTVTTMPLDLEPDTVYALSITYGDKLAFVDRFGQPVLPFPTCFRTRPAEQSDAKRDARTPPWQETTAGGCTYYSMPGDDWSRGAGRVANQLRGLAEFAGVEPPGKVCYYKYPDALTMHRLTGRPESEFVVRGKAELHTIHPFPYVRLSLLLGSSAPQPPQLIERGTLLSNWGAVDWLPFPHYAYNLLASGNWVPLRDLLADGACERYPLDVVRSEGAALIGWVIDEFGEERAHELYRTTRSDKSASWNAKAIAEVLDMPLGAVERRIKSALRAIYEAGIFRETPLGVADLSHAVYIIPTHEPDPAAQARVHAFVRKVAGDAQVITDEQALRLDLSSTPTLAYGTLDGNAWLTRYQDEFPFRIEPDRIVIGDEVYEGSGHSLATSWPHPQNAAVGLHIVTGQHADDIATKAVVYNSTWDFNISRDGKQIETGCYRKTRDGWSEPRGSASATGTGLTESERWEEMAAATQSLEFPGFVSEYAVSNAEKPCPAAGMAAVIWPVGGVRGWAVDVWGQFEEPVALISCNWLNAFENWSRVDPRLWKPASDRFAELLPEYVDALKLDPDRIYITGHSFGGMLAWQLADDHPDLIAGLLAVAVLSPGGQLQADLPDGSKCVTVILDGDRDPRFTPLTQQRRNILWARDIVLRGNPHSKFLLLEGQGHNSVGQYRAEYLRYLLQFRRGGQQVRGR